MKIYELAKDMGWDTKGFMAELEKAGITGKTTHLNKLSDEEQTMAKTKIMNKNKPVEKEVKPEPVKEIKQEKKVDEKHTEIKKTNIENQDHIVKEKVFFDNKEKQNKNNDKTFESRKMVNKFNKEDNRDLNKKENSNKTFENRDKNRPFDKNNKNNFNRDNQRDGKRFDKDQNRDGQRDGRKFDRDRDGQKDGYKKFDKEQNRDNQRDGRKFDRDRDGQKDGRRFDREQNRDGQKDGYKKFDKDREGFKKDFDKDRDNGRDRGFNNKKRDHGKQQNNVENDMASVVAPAGEKPTKGNNKSNKSKFDKKKYEKEKKQKEEEKKLRELRSDFRKDDKKKKSKKKDDKKVKDEIVRIDGESIGMITIGEEIVIKDLAEKLGINVSDIIKKFFMAGKMLTANAILTFEEAEEVALDYEVIVEREEVVEVSYGEKYNLEIEDKEQDLVTRAPVITIMGHVDHGKTSLLDALRHTNVIEGEAGGITQKIGAYQVKWNGQKITFIDTPGHEAFTEMRARGANITDITILIVAADDGVKPQTVEAISHAKEAGVPIIVAINKIDKPGADPMRVKTELTEYGLISPDWGGTTEFVEISAKQKINLEELLETILITAELQELKANPKKRVKGVVIESRLDPKMGAVADILIQEGQLEIGDIFVAGESYGRVRSMVDDRGNKIEKAEVSQPVEITGFSVVPNAGDVLYGVNNDKQAKKIVEDYIKEKKANEQNKKKHISLESLSQELEDQQLKELKCIIRADSKGSVEALKESLNKLNNDKVMINVIQASAGAVTEGDIKLAEASNAIVIAFNVRPTTPAINEAEKTGVEIRNYNVIYHLTEEIEKAMTGMLDPEFKEVYLGRIEVKQVFKISNVGNIAGSIVVDGKVSKASKIRVLRDGIIIFDGEIATLKRFKDEAKEVVMGQECGIQIKDFNDIKEGDIIESYIMEEIPR